MCNSCIPQIDTSKTDAFAEQLIQMLNHGTLSLMVSVGHRVGLFDTMEQLAAVSSYEIAAKANLQERYVREWLGAMVTGGIVDYQPETETYSLQPEKAALLTRNAGADNIGVYLQYIAILGSVEDQIVQCFKDGGGVAYEDYNRFHDVMAEDSGLTVLSSLAQHILPLVPGIEAQLEKGISVLDIGCGQGKAITLLAEKYPNSQFLGIDLCEEPIEKANDQVREKGLQNIQFRVQDLTDFESDQSFDLITAFDVIHDQKRPDIVLSNVYQALKNDGTFLMQDIDASSHLENNMDHPVAPMLYTISTMHCMTVSLAQGGMGLGTMWGTEKAEEMLQEAGFANVSIHRLEHDFQNCYYVIKK